MKHLLATTGTIEKGVGFDLFGACHLTWLAVLLAFMLVCCIAYRRMNTASRRWLRLLMAAAILADEALKMAVLLIGGTFTVHYLPLHLCSINLFLIAWHALRPSPTLDNYLYITCTPGALAALLFPSWTALPPTSLMHIHSFTFHILLATYPVMLLSGSDIRPQLRAVPQALLLLAGLAGIATAANQLLGTNFMFLAYAPTDNPLYWFERNWGSHLWGYAVLIPVLIGGLYAQEILHSLRHRRRTAM